MDTFYDCQDRLRNRRRTGIPYPVLSMPYWRKVFDLLQNGFSSGLCLAGVVFHIPAIRSAEVGGTAEMMARRSEPSDLASVKWRQLARRQGLLRDEPDTSASRAPCRSCGVSLAYLEEFASSIKEVADERGLRIDSTSAVMQRLIMASKTGSAARWDCIAP